MFAPLNPAHIAAIEPCFVRQSFLRHPKFTPFGADAFAEDVEIGDWIYGFGG